MAEQYYTLVADANGVLPNLPAKSLGFAARSMRIDNPTGAWLFVTQLGKRIPPYTLSWTMAISDTQVGEIRADPPTGQTQLARAGQTAVIIFSDVEIGADSAGYNIQSPGIQSLFANAFVSAGPTIQPTTLNATFYIRSVRVDNPTGQWLYLDVPGAYIPPYTVGWTMNVNPTLSVTIRSQTPGGQVSNPILGQWASIIVTDTPITTPSTGLPIIPDSTQVSANTMTVAGGVMPTLNAGPWSFTARSVRIDNPTGQWLFLTTPGLWIPPYTTGFSANIGPSLTGQVLAITPITEISYPVNGQIARVNFSDTLTVEAPGVPVLRDQPQYTVYTMTIAAGPTMPTLNASLTYLAKSVRIDNPTGSWLVFAVGGGNIWIPPFTIGWSFKLSPTNALSISQANPPNAGFSRLIPGQAATVLFSDIEQPESSGMAIEVPYQQGLRTIISLPFPATTVISPSFGVVSIVVDNNSGQWVFVFANNLGANQGQWIKPYTLGWAINVAFSTSITVLCIVPNNVVQNAPLASQQIQVHVYDYNVAESNGIELINPYQLQQAYTSVVAAGALPAININTNTYAVPFSYRSLRIDNPTGCWLYIAGPGVYVPPYTVGWAMNFSLTNVNTISNVTPPGQLSNPINGQNVLVTASDFPIQESNGVLVQNPDLAAPSDVKFFSVQAIAAGGVATITTLIAGVATRRIRVLSYQIVWEYRTPGAAAIAALDQIRDNSTGIILMGLPQSVNVGAASAGGKQYALANDSGLLQTITVGGALDMLVNGVGYISNYFVNGSYILV